MAFFHYQDGELYADQVELRKVAEQFGTPCYVYSRSALESNWQQLDKAFAEHQNLICYSVKANSNLAVLNLLARLGSGFDIVSGGEFRRVMIAGGDPDKVVFSGVAKSAAEIELVLINKIHCIHVESVAELQRIQQIAERLNVIAPIAIRVNPDIDPQTHPYIATGLSEAKFGIAMEDALQAYQLATDLANIKIRGIACHIGSQITQTSPFTDALERIVGLLIKLNDQGIKITTLGLGGGLGIQYKDEAPPSIEQYAQSLIGCLRKHNIELPITLEPGRSIVGNAGLLLTKVEYLKHSTSKSFAIVDAGMNDLLRPSLYQSFHDIIAVTNRPDCELTTYDVVGPVCETGDVLGYDRQLAIVADDLLAVCCAGAYGRVMSSNYNSRPRPPEIMVDGTETHLINHRESEQELTAGEAILP